MPNRSSWPASVDHPEFIAPDEDEAAGDDIELTELLRQMLLIREVEDRVLDLRGAGEIAGSVHPCIGQESGPVGISSLLDERDRILATYRGHGVGARLGRHARSAAR